MHAHIHTHIHTYMHTYIHTHIHSYIHTYIHAYIHTHTHTYTHTRIHTYIHTSTRTNTHADIYTCTYVRMLMCLCVHACERVCTCVYTYNVYVDLCIRVHFYRRMIRHEFKQQDSKTPHQHPELKYGTTAFSYTYQSQNMQGTTPKSYGGVNTAFTQINCEVRPLVHAHRHGSITSATHRSCTKTFRYSKCVFMTMRSSHIIMSPTLPSYINVCVFHAPLALKGQQLFLRCRPSLFIPCLVSSS